MKKNIARATVTVVVLLALFNVISFIMMTALQMHLGCSP